MHAVKLLVVLLLTVSGVVLHALHASVSIKDGRLRVEAFYDDDLPAQRAKVTLSSSDPNSRSDIIRGETDDSGVWEVALPAPGDYKLIVDAGAGHKTTKFVTVATTPPPADGENGDDRASLTAFPWTKLLLGITAIALFFGALAGILRWKQRAWGRLQATGP